MQIVVNSQIDVNKWIYLLNNGLYSSLFQTPDFYRFYKNVDGFTADVFAVERDAKYLSLVVVTIQKEKGLKAFFSRRGIIYGGPLVMEDTGASLEFLLQSIGNYYIGKVIYLEIRNLNNYSGFANIFTKEGWRYKSWLNFIIRIKNIEDNFKLLNSEKRRQIRNSLKAGTSIRYISNPNIDIIEKLIVLFKNLYKRRIKKPMPSEEFFIQLAKEQFSKILIVEYNGNIIGGGFLVYDEQIVYEWFRVGDDMNYKRLQPSSVAAWGSIKFGIENNCTSFDFMGAGSPDDNYGVREFKSQFGGDLVEYGRFIKIVNPLLYKFGKIGIWLMKALPK